MSSFKSSEQTTSTRERIRRTLTSVINRCSLSSEFPRPLQSVTLSPPTPAAAIADLTASSWCGRINAMMRSMLNVAWGVSPLGLTLSEYKLQPQTTSKHQNSRSACRRRSWRRFFGGGECCLDQSFGPRCSLSLYDRHPAHERESDRCSQFALARYAAFLSRHKGHFEEPAEEVTREQDHGQADNHQIRRPRLRTIRPSWPVHVKHLENRVVHQVQAIGEETQTRDRLPCKELGKWSPWGYRA